MDRQSRFAASLVLAVGVALAGCGGGGDGALAAGGGDVLQVTFTPQPLVFSTFEDWFGRRVYETVTVSPVPTETPYVFVTDSAATFVAGTITVTALGGNSFRASLPIRDGLAPGTYSGTLTVQICRDAACADPYVLSDATLSYSITIRPVIAGLPPLTATVSVDGVATTDVSEGLAGSVRTYTISIRSGQTVELVPSVPFVSVSTWNNGTVITMLPPGQAGTIRATVSLASGATSGSAELSGRADDGRTVRLTVNVVP
jgi:hypothetical protein